MKNELKLTISNGNKKMGLIKSVSLPPGLTCADGCKCIEKCYAMKLCRIYKNVEKSYNNNFEFYLNKPKEYFEEVYKAACTQRFFRWHVGGDIVDYRYFLNMVYIADVLPNTEFLVFTKKYDIVNEYLYWEGGHKPSNLHLIFSAWDGMEMKNPYNLPVAHVLPKKAEVPEGWELCGGNCLECALGGVGCWHMLSGEHIAFYEH